MQADRICGVILAYGSVLDVIKAVRSLKAAEASSEILVVQNGLSTEQMRDVLTECPYIQVVFNPINKGAAGGRNIGIKNALSLGAEYIFFLDRDAWIKPDAIAILVEEAKKNTNAALLSCLVFNPKTINSIHSAGAHFSPPDLRDIHIRDYPEKPVTQVDYVITTAALVKAKVFADVGFFDERYFAYFEDLDWAERACRKGYCNYVVRDAVGYHDEERSRFHPLPIYYLARNRFFFAHKHGFITGKHDPKILTVWWKHAITIIRHLFAFRPLAFTCLIAHLIGLIDFVNQRFGKGPQWIETPPESFLENRLRKHIFESKLYTFLRDAKHSKGRID